MTEPHIFIGLSPLDDRTIFAAENEEGHQLFRVTAEEEVAVERDDEVRRYRIERIDGDGVHVSRLDEDFPAGSHRGLRPKQRVVMRDRFGRRFEFSVSRSEPGGAVLRPARMSSLEILGESPGELAPVEEGTGEDGAAHREPRSRSPDEESHTGWDDEAGGAEARDEKAWDEGAGDENPGDEEARDDEAWDAPLQGTPRRGRAAEPGRLEDVDEADDLDDADLEGLDDLSEAVHGAPPEETPEPAGSHPAAQAQLAEYVRLLDLMANHGLRPLRAGTKAWQCYPFPVSQKACERLLERDHALVREEGGVDYLEITRSGRDYLEANRTELRGA